MLSQGTATRCPNNDCGAQWDWEEGAFQFPRYTEEGLFYQSESVKWTLVWGVVNANTGSSFQKLRREVRQRRIEQTIVQQREIDTSLDVNALRDMVAQFNSDLCKRLVKDLLTEAGSPKEGNDEPVHTDLLNLFDVVRQQEAIILPEQPS